eukprot:m51a1_g10881 Endosomal Syntaxin C (95) ;mRNA; r:18308-23570
MATLWAMGVIGMYNGAVVARKGAALVQEQGVVIDNIKVNVSSAVHNMKDSNVELAKANRKQAKSRNTGCCLLAMAAAILAVVVLIIVLPSVLVK